MDELQSLINSTLPFIEKMLRNHGEFYPLASALDSSGKIAQMGAYDGNEHPKSVDVINDLKKNLKQGAQKGEYSAITIF